MDYRNPIGNTLDVHILSLLDRVIERQKDTHRAILETQRTVERIDIRTSMQTNQPAQQKMKKQWNIQLMVYVAICALALGGHITMDEAKAILTVSPR